jgi:hypothetical protein
MLAGVTASGVPSLSLRVGAFSCNSVHVLDRTVCYPAMVDPLAGSRLGPTSLSISRVKSASTRIRALTRARLGEEAQSGRSGKCKHRGSVQGASRPRSGERSERSLDAPECSCKIQSRSDTTTLAAADGLFGRVRNEMRGPYRFFFFSSDRGEPIQVHVKRDRKLAKLWLAPAESRTTMDSATRN